jgi:hypothetical protein
MKKLLALLVIAVSVFVLGCGEPPAEQQEVSKTGSDAAKAEKDAQSGNEMAGASEPSSE